ncbi:MAG: hypothetical protein HQK49_22920 [Oligoflexia bacterium]|nr:hypothetical protein [Oligoflexia bacterium]
MKVSLSAKVNLYGRAAMQFHKGPIMSSAVNDNRDQSLGTPTSKNASIWSFLVRMYWMFGWFIVLLVSARISLNKTLGAFSFLPLLLLCCSMVLVRYIDIYHYQGSTVDGRPADKKDLFFYSATSFLVIFFVFIVTTYFH